MQLANKKVLVLNADYRALAVCNVYKAFLLVYMQKAEITDTKKKIKLRTVSKSYDVPSVIRLNKYVHIPYKGIMMTRQNIFKRDGNECQYCKSKKNLTIDHVIPKSRGGKSTWENLVTACRRCNTSKGSKTLEEAGMKLSKKPFKPSFVMFLRDFSGTTDENWNSYLNLKQA